MDPILSTLITSGTTLAGIWLTKFLEKRFSRSTPDLSQPEIEEIVQPILDKIRAEMGAFRVDYWEGSNGEKTLSGYHIKKLSMFAEALDEGAKTIREECKLLPVSMFGRNITKMRVSSAHYLISHEIELNDDLAIWYQNYGVHTLLMFKVKTKLNRWTGILSVCYNTKTNLTHQQLVWLEAQVGRIGNLVSK
jgi:hypothetical protein